MNKFNKHQSSHVAFLFSRLPINGIPECCDQDALCGRNSSQWHSTMMAKSSTWRCPIRIVGSFRIRFGDDCISRITIFGVWKHYWKLPHLSQFESRITTILVVLSNARHIMSRASLSSHQTTFFVQFSVLAGFQNLSVYCTSVFRHDQTKFCPRRSAHPWITMLSIQSKCKK